jgi:benzil reductase ((S)-benzoin forming)
MGHFAADAIPYLLAINAVAPLQLMNAFLAHYAGGAADLLVCNLTSTGAHNPVRGSSLYCAAKAAIEMATKVAALEAESAGNPRLRFLIANPGGMASDMWTGLTQASPDDLPDVAILRKRNPPSPEEVADRLCRVLADPSLVPELAFDVQALPAI